MEGPDLLDALVEVAERAGIAVRVLPRGDGEPGPHSGPCRIRGAPWLLLAPGDPLEEQIAAAVDAIRRYAPEAGQGWLPPAVRDRLDAP